MNGTGVRRLTHDPAADENPAYSADGSSIVFTSNRDGARGLYVMDAAGGAARRLTPPGEVADNATWRPGVDLQLVIDRPAPLRRGRVAQISIRIRSRTSAVVSDVRVAGRLPAGIRLVGARTKGARCTGRVAVSCFRGRLAPGRSASIRLGVRPTRCGPRTLSLTAASLQMDRAPADNRRRVQLRVRC
jgi:WD40-like Beta Propeller Repeat